MNQQLVTVNRAMVGGVAAVLLVIAGLLTVFGVDPQSMWTGACLKVGLVMGAFWLTLPAFTRSEELGKASLTSVLTALVAALIVGCTKIPLRIIVPALIVSVIVLRILQPRRRTRPPRVE